MEKQITNLSKINRDKMLDTIKQIKKYVNDNDDILRSLSQIEYELTKKKYGLVWEEHQEEVDKQLETKIPVFTEKKKFEIINNSNDNFNFLLEGDNLHSLYLLEKTHRGKIDLIYIDPPYNTGAKTWKYNNDYVDSNDMFSHSKWISMMDVRLRRAKKLLKDDGALICAIDENELCTLGLLLDEIFGQSYEIHCVTIVHNPRGIQGKNFSYTHEYAYFVFKRGEKVIGNRKIDDKDVDWRNLRDNGGESLRTDAKNCFYPIIVKDSKIIGFGDVVDDSIHPKQNEYIDGNTYIYPIDRQGIERKWRYARQSVEKIVDMLKVEIKNNRAEVLIGKNFGTYKTVWVDPKYDANEYGKKILNNLVKSNNFDFPKSLYNVYDCLYAVVSDRKDAIVLDYFAGSGTTGHAVELMNSEDGGNRKYILCTNNENNICEDVTYERIKAVTNSNLKYYQTDFVPKENSEKENLRENLLVNIKNLIQLENGIDIDDKTIKILMTEDLVDKFSENEKELDECQRLYIPSDVLLTSEQEEILKNNNIEVYNIPEYYFSKEIMEVE